MQKSEEKKQVAEFIQMPGINERRAMILKWYYEEPLASMTVREVEKRLGISNQTARNDLNHIKELGFLRAIQIDLKKEAFLRAENFENLLLASKAK